jgi:hypothetical protein
MGIKTTQNFTLISTLLRKKFANKKVIGKRSVQNWSFSSSILLTCNSGCTFFKYFHIFEISVFLIRYGTHTVFKKRNKKKFGSLSTVHTVYEYFLEIEEFEFARIGLTNRKTFLTNIFENITYFASFCW